MTAASLCVRDLKVGYTKSENVLDGVSLTVATGECVGLLGHNGAGKTTLLRAIAGLVNARSGSVHFKERDLRSVSAPARVNEGIVLVPQGRALFPKMSVEENIKLGAFRRSVDGPEHAWEEQTRRIPWFTERRKEKVQLLSGGQQQLVANARGLASDPQLLMVDEPSVGLAGVAVADLSELLQGMRKSGLTILLVEQNLGLALAVCDRFIVLREGKIVGEYERDNLPVEGLWSLF